LQQKATAIIVCNIARYCKQADVTVQLSSMEKLLQLQQDTGQQSAPTMTAASAIWCYER
jgi:hypothetical protein